MFLRCFRLPEPEERQLRSTGPGEWRNWQTRRIQVPVIARSWGFNSPLAHPTKSSNCRSLIEIGAGERCGLGSQLDTLPSRVAAA